MLSVLSKILEKFIKHHLYEYLESSGLLASNQFGFRRGKGVDEALFSLCNDLYAVRERKSKGILLCLDQAKAFDSIEREKLLVCMESFGIVGDEIKWFKSYLSARYQVVSIDETLSAMTRNDYGVIQGSTLGPILFLMYINSIVGVSRVGKFYLFADDTAILVEGESWSQVYSLAQQVLDNLNTWLIDNTLTLNVKKTKFLTFGYIDARYDDLSEHALCIHSCLDRNQCSCDEIERVPSHKYLGVLIDDKLSWEPQVNLIHSKLKKFIFIFYNVRRTLTFESMRLLYTSMVQSVLQFGVIVWGSAVPSILNKLIVLQKGIIKVMLGKHRRFPSIEVYQHSKLFSLGQLYIRKLAMFYHKHNDILAHHSSSSYSTRFLSSGNYVNPKIRLSLSTRSPMYVIYSLHKNLDKSLKFPQNYSRNSYKKEITSWLIEIGSSLAFNLIVSCYR